MYVYDFDSDTGDFKKCFWKHHKSKLSNCFEW
jgi:hypothetical protein